MPALQPTSPAPSRTRHPEAGKILTVVLGFGAVAAAGILGVSFYFSSSSIHELLTENNRLREAVENLSREEQIGYATVREQERDEDGNLRTVVRFVQTAAGKPRQIVSEELFTIQGDTVHFDALVVKFTEEFVRDGTERALYLWRRIYGEDTKPSEGTPIESTEAPPERYYDITSSLRLQDRSVFWQAIWDLANNPEQLSEYGVRAVYGNTVYTRMEPGKVYLFKLTASGQIYPETVDHW